MHFFSVISISSLERLSFLYMFFSCFCPNVILKKWGFLLTPPIELSPDNEFLENFVGVKPRYKSLLRLYNG